MSLPKRNFAATYVNGTPVAYEANALLRKSLAFTSMMRNYWLLGSTAYMMLRTPTTPKWRTPLAHTAASGKY